LGLGRPSIKVILPIATPEAITVGWLPVSGSSDSVPVVAIPNESLVSIVNYPRPVIAATNGHCTPWGLLKTVAIPTINTITAVFSISTNYPAICYGDGRARESVPVMAIPVKNAIAAIYYPRVCPGAPYLNRAARNFGPTVPSAAID